MKKIKSYFFLISVFTLFNNCLALDQTVIERVKSGVLLLATCKEQVDITQFRASQHDLFRRKQKLSYDQYQQLLQVFNTMKSICARFESRRRGWAYMKTSTGSAFLINNNGYIVTNDHVVSAGKKHVVLDGGMQREHIKLAEVVARWPQYDLALLKVTDLDNAREPLVLAAPNIVNRSVGMDVWSYGFPGISNIAVPKFLSVEVKFDKGIIRAKPEKRNIVDNVNSVTMIEHSAQIYAGNSGGPLVDNCGRVLGINQSIPSQPAKIGFAVHVSYLHTLLNENRVKYVSASENCAVSSAEMQSGFNYIYLFAFGILIPTGLFLFFRRRKKLSYTRLASALVKQNGILNADKDWVLNGNLDMSNYNFKAAPKDLFCFLIGREKMKGKNRELCGKGRLIIGRGANADIVVDNDSVGRKHLELSWDNKTGVLWLKDLGSVNGSYLDTAGDSDQQLIPNQVYRIESGSCFYLAEKGISFRVIPKPK